MKCNYTIILFKNKVRYKTFKKFESYKRANAFYEKKLSDSKNVFFEVQIENDEKVEFEIALVEKNSKKDLKLFKTDMLGRNIEILSDDENMTIIKIDNFNMSEKIFHVDMKKRVDCDFFIKTFLKSKDLKMISKLNNKIIVQENDDVNLFTLKNSDEANRFLDNLQIKLMDTKNSSCLIVKDVDTAQKKYLYNFLKNRGYNEKMLYRKSTTHS
jgi:hypothetical protein